jgi:hypothetical protein
LTGNTPDISYQPVWFYEPSAFPEQRKYLARWIGIAHRVGQALCYWFLPEFGIPITRTSIQSITATELQTTNIKQMSNVYDQKIKDKLQQLSGTSNNPMILSLYREDEDPQEDEEEDSPIESIPLPIEEDSYDALRLTEPILDTSNGKIKAKIIGHKHEQDGQLVGKHNSNPILNTRVYLAEIPDGTVSEYVANVIAGAIYDQVNDDGYDTVLFAHIVGREYLPTMDDIPTYTKITRG